MDTERQNKPKYQSTFVGISEIVEKYIPISKRKARQFVMLYLKPKRIGNRIYVNRKQLEALLNDSNKDSFPLLTDTCNKSNQKQN